MITDSPDQPEELQTIAQEDRQPVIKWGWLRAVLFLPAWFLVSIVAAGVAFLAFGVTNEEQLVELIDTPAGILIHLVILTVTLIPVFLYRKLIDRRSFVSLGFRLNPQFAKDLLAGVLWGIGLISVVFAVLRLSGQIVITEIRVPDISFIYVIIVMILIAINEELVVRGYLLSNLMASIDKYAALLITSLLFSAGHIANPNASWPGLVNIILAGLLLGIYYVHKQNLWFPIGLHFSWNLFQGSVYGSQVSGVSIESILMIEVTGNDLITGGEFGFEASIVTTAALILATGLVHFIYRPRKKADRPVADAPAS